MIFEMLADFNTQVTVILGTSLGGFGIAAIRYFIKKEKCDAAVKTSIEFLKKESIEGHKAHAELRRDIRTTKEDVAEIKGMIKTLKL